MNKHLKRVLLAILIVFAGIGLLFTGVFVAPFAHRDVAIAQLRQILSQRRQLVVVGGKQRAAADRIVNMLDYLSHVVSAICRPAAPNRFLPICILNYAVLYCSLQVTMADGQSAERACKDPNPIIDGRKANVNLAYLGAKPRSVQEGGCCLRLSIL